MSFPTVDHPSKLPQCCGRGVHARGTAGKGYGDIYACSVCYRDLGTVNGDAQRSALADYEVRLAAMRRGGGR